MDFPDIADFRVLVVPGWHGSGEGHWQSRWERQYPFMERVEQEDWERPDLPIWSAQLRKVLKQSSRPTLVVAHSFGCLATVHCAQEGEPALAGALLVAPADPARFGATELLRNATLNCPAITIGSLDDPWMDAKRALQWASAWNSRFVSAGCAGHINAESSLGDWPFGLGLLRELLAAVRASAHA